MATTGNVVEVDSAGAVDALAQRITTAQRTSAIVVVTIAEGAKSPYFDVDQIAEGVGFRADTYVIADRWVSPLSLRMPGACGVFAGAARVYPPHWDQHPGTARVFPAKSVEEARRQTRALVDLVKPPRREPVRTHEEAAPPRSLSASPIARALLADRPLSEAMTLQHLDEVDALITLLALPTRRHPVVVVTIPAGRTEPYVDPDTVVGVAPGRVHALVLPTGPLSWRLSGAIGDLAGVYGGAARVYAIDNGWVSNPFSSPLHFSYDKGDGARVAEMLASEVLADLHRQGGVSEEIRPTKQATGKVEGFIAQTRALVRLTDGQLATVWAEVTAEGCDIDRLVTKGLTMTGALDADSKRLDVSEMLLPPMEAMAHYRVGDVVLVRVDDVTLSAAVVCLMPGVRIGIPIEDISDNPLDAATDLFTVGETVPARLTQRSDEGSWRVAFLDVDDDDEPVDAPAVLRGGPPWLLKPPARVPAPEVVNLTTEPPLVSSEEDDLRPAEPPHVATDELSERLAALDIERAGLVKELRREKAKSHSLAEQLESSKRQVRNLRGTQKKAKAISTGDGDWLSAEDALRWELTRTWVSRVSAQDKSSRPLPAYDIGSDFIASLNAMHTIQREKILQVVVEVLLGWLPRDTHALRSNTSGGSPPVVRDDGATCMRSPLQDGTPSARRLHWWRLRNGAIELSRVVVHDDYTP